MSPSRWALAGAGAVAVGVAALLAPRLAGPREASAAQVERMCTSCHRLPPPDALPRFAWRESVEAMYGFAMIDPLRPPAPLPPAEETIAYFEARAPEALPLVRGAPPLDEGGPFSKRPRRELAPKDAPPLPGAGCVQVMDVAGDPRPELVVCDVRHGLVLVGHPQGAGPLTAIAKVPAPVHAALCDLDRDGRRDLVVADLGTLKPEDHDRGGVVWLRRAKDGGFEARRLPLALGRVAWVEAADLDGDGDQDLVVAEFGFRKTGRLLLLENQGGAPGEEPKLALRVLDERHGAVALALVDLDGDGRRDVVALLAQEHEALVWLRSAGGCAFEGARDLWRAPHPAWGSVSLEMADLDGDGDQDALVCNGDTLDDHVLKPYQGVSWLENTGTPEGAKAPAFVERRLLAPFYGAQCARAADIDLDGDLDIVACSFLPRMSTAEVRGPLGIASIVRFEQTAKGVFEAHAVEMLACDHPSLALADVDGDGDPDLVVGTFIMAQPEPGTEGRGWATVYENATR